VALLALEAVQVVIDRPSDRNLLAVELAQNQLLQQQKPLPTRWLLVLVGQVGFRAQAPMRQTAITLCLPPLPQQLVGVAHLLTPRALMAVLAVLVVALHLLLPHLLPVEQAKQIKDVLVGTQQRQVAHLVLVVAVAPILKALTAALLLAATAVVVSLRLWLDRALAVLAAAVAAPSIILMLAPQLTVVEALSISKMALLPQ